jgi:integrase
LAAGETPEWIARQLGHASTEMLFRVYSRYVPNLTRQDGSAMDRLLAMSFANVNAANAPSPAATNDAKPPKAQPPPVRALIAA